ncbi:hypothetical protein SLS60_002981 [Paraconiothyrium brasiliense]|uniref:Uncharacterized protein n=1 Tax=Paraconiothyrium brasiliense TaxID=300254 RepID=A0ABR3RUC4_9PLEO
MRDSGSEYQELSWLIDNISPPSVRRSATATGHRKYLWTSHRSPSHVETLLRFCEGVAKRVAEVSPVALDQPLPYPPSECGYSVNSHIRISQHCHRQSSNYVMNLVEDICTYLHEAGTFPRLFRMQPFIVYLIFRPQQAAIAEIFCSGLLQVWIEEGGGVNAYPAGRSVASARRVSAAQWADHEQWVVDNTEMVKNVRIQKERLEEDVSRLDMKMEEVWREALESEDEGDGNDPRDLDYVPDDLAEEFEGLRLEPKL